MSGNSFKVSDNSAKRRKEGESSGILCSWGNLIVAAQQNADNQTVL